MARSHLALLCTIALIAACESTSAQSEDAPRLTDRPEQLACDKESAAKRMDAIPSSDLERRAAEIESGMRTQDPRVSDEIVKAKSAQLAKLEAEIGIQHDCYRQRPWRRSVGLKAAPPRFVRYVDDWCRAIEHSASQRISSDLAKKLGGHSLVAAVAIKANGEVESFEIRRSSGDSDVDAFAKRLVVMAGPFRPFPSDIRVDTDILTITKTWTFLPPKDERAPSQSLGVE
jgi:periplasmic protein TonB